MSIQIQKEQVTSLAKAIVKETNIPHMKALETIAHGLGYPGYHQLCAVLKAVDNAPQKWWTKPWKIGDGDSLLLFTGIDELDAHANILFRADATDDVRHQKEFLEQLIAFQNSFIAGTRKMKYNAGIYAWVELEGPFQIQQDCHNNPIVTDVNNEMLGTIETEYLAKKDFEAFGKYLLQVLNGDNAEIYACDNCTWMGCEENAVEAKDISQRMLPGDTFTSYECPDCGALVFPV